jgi:hypothetical protein
VEQLKTTQGILVGAVLVLGVLYFLTGKGNAPNPTTNRDREISTNPARLAFTKSSIASRQRNPGISSPALADLDFDTPLNTEAEKQAFLDEAKKWPASELLSAWKQQLAKPNYAQLDFVEIALANRIRDNPDSEEAKAIYGFAADAFDNGGLDEVGRMRLVKWLGQGGGGSVVQLLLGWFDQTGNKELRREILSQIASTSGRAAYGQSAESVSRILETRWRAAAMPGDLDSGLLTVLGQAIAKTGNPGGIRVLLDEVERGGPTRQQFETESDAKARLALLSLSKLRSEASVDLLAQGMQHGSPDDMRFLASGEALANISKPASTKVLIDWARQADDSNAPLVVDWLSRLRDYDSRKMVRYLFVENVTFHSEQVKQAAAAAIKSYD